MKVYLCIERSESGAKGTLRILRVPDLRKPLFLQQKNQSPKQMNIVYIDASSPLLAQCQAEPFNGL